MKNLIRLICLSFILLTTYATAEITIDANTIHVETDAYKVQFDSGVITYLHNKLTGETYTLPLGTNRNPGFRAETGILKRDPFSRARFADRNLFIWTHDATEIETRKIDIRIPPKLCFVEVETRSELLSV